MSSPGDEPSRQDSFEQLYSETRVAILSYLTRRVSNPADAADLLAETYLIAWRKVDTIPNDQTARLWLYGVARRIMSHHRRHEMVEQGLAEALRADLNRETARLQADRDVPFSDVVAVSLARLKPSDREIMELSAWEQLTAAEIADLIGMKPGSVRVRLHRIRAVIRADLIGAGYPRCDRLDRVG
jgi:RNA polymerase sigma factor (sigma-70 family)